MQWSQIKTLFILCFLVLNVYLTVQFINKQDEADIGELDNQEAPFKDRLESEKISIGDIETDIVEASYLKASQKTFTKKEKRELSSLKNQHATVINHNFILSQFDDPIPISDQMKKEDLYQALASYTLFPDDYVYWGWNQEKNVLVFFQQENDRPVYFNQHGLLLVYLNEDNEMVFYTQTMLDDPEPQGDKKTLNEPIQAVETLYKRNHLYPEDDVKSVEMGYYTRILSEGVQVFAPTWKVSVQNGEPENTRTYFVNAIEGLVLDSKDFDFLETAIEENIRKVSAMDSDSKVKEKVLTHLKQMIDESNRSEDK